MKNQLVTPDQLLSREANSQEDLQTQVAKLKSAMQVLEQSIAAQRQVAQSVEDKPDLYPVAIRVIEGLTESYGELALHAGLLDLQSLLGTELQVAIFLNTMAQQIRQNNQNQIARAEAMQQQQQADNLGDGAVDAQYTPAQPDAGTSVASEENSDEENQPAKEPEESVH